MINNKVKETPLNQDFKKNSEDYYKNVKDEAISSVETFNKNRTNSNSSEENYNTTNNSESFIKLSNSLEKSNNDSISSKENLTVELLSEEKNEENDIEEVDMNNNIEEKVENKDFEENSENNESDDHNINGEIKDISQNNEDEEIKEILDNREEENIDINNSEDKEQINQIEDKVENNENIEKVNKEEKDIETKEGNNTIIIEKKLQEQKLKTEKENIKKSESLQNNSSNFDEAEKSTQDEKITKEEELPKKHKVPSFSEEQIRKTITHYKQIADNHFCSQNYKIAIENYEKGLNYLHFEQKPGQKNIVIDKELVIKFLNNKTQCFLNLKESQKALSNALFVLKLDSFNIKGYYRAGKACNDLKKYETGYKILQKGLQYLEKDHSFRSHYIRLFNLVKNEYNLGLNALKNKMRNFTQKKKKEDLKKEVNLERGESILLWNKKVFAFSLFNSILLSGICPYLYNNNLHEKFVMPIYNFIEWFGKFFNLNKLLSVLAVFGLGYTIGYLFQYFFNNKNKNKKILS